MKRLLLLLLVGCGTDMTGLVGLAPDSGVDDGHVVKGGRPVPDAIMMVDVTLTPDLGAGGAPGAGGSGGAGGGTADWSPCPGGQYYNGTCLPTCGDGVKILDVKWCAPMTYPGWECVNGRLNGVNVKCPFDVAIAMGSGWNGPCQGCIDAEIVTNGDFSRSASYKSSASIRYFCDGTGAGPTGNLGTRLCAKRP